MKPYIFPEANFISVCATDVLTISNAGDGDDQSIYSIAGASCSDLFK